MWSGRALKCQRIHKSMRTVEVDPQDDRGGG